MKSWISLRRRRTTRIRWLKSPKTTGCSTLSKSCFPRSSQPNSRISSRLNEKNWTSKENWCSWDPLNTSWKTSLKTNKNKLSRRPGLSTKGINSNPSCRKRNMKMNCWGRTSIVWKTKKPNWSSRTASYRVSYKSLRMTLLICKLRSGKPRIKTRYTPKPSKIEKDWSKKKENFQDKLTDYKKKYTQLNLRSKEQNKKQKTKQIWTDKSKRNLEMQSKLFSTFKVNSNLA